jgi:hypothetical protein
VPTEDGGVTGGWVPTDEGASGGCSLGTWVGVRLGVPVSVGTCVTVDDGVVGTSVVRRLEAGPSLPRASKRRKRSSMKRTSRRSSSVVPSFSMM